MSATHGEKPLDPEPGSSSLGHPPTRSAFQVRFHGRGGQGVVTAAELLSVAAFLEGRHAQAFPSFGSERSGAPVAAFCRISDVEIRTHEPVVTPDAIVIQDATLLHQVDLFQGLEATGFLLVNTSRSFSELGLGRYLSPFPLDHLATVPATELALRLVGRPLPNAALLGGLTALTDVVQLDSVVAAIRERFAGAVGESNAAAAVEAHRFVRHEKEEADVAASN